MTSKGRISSSQFFIMIFVSRVIVMITINAKYAGGENMLDDIVSYLISAAVGFAVALPVLALNRKYPDMNLCGVSGLNLGAAGKLVPAVYLIYLVAVDAITASLFHIFITEAVHPKLLPWLIILAVLACALYGAVRGLEAIARCAVCVFAALILGMVFIFAAAVPRLDFSNLDPLFYNGFSQTWKGVMLFFGRSTTFADIALLLPLVKGKKLGGLAVWSLGGALFFGLTIFYTVCCLGRFAYIQSFPVYTLASITKVNSLPRLDAVFIGVWIMGLVIKLSCDIYACGVCLREIFPIKGQKMMKAFEGIVSTLIFLLFFLIIKFESLKEIMLSVDFLFYATLVTGALIPSLIYVSDIIRDRISARRNKKYYGKDKGF